MLAKQYGSSPHVMSYCILEPITAQYWRLRTINNSIATTEFAIA